MEFIPTKTIISSSYKENPHWFGINYNYSNLKLYYKIKKY